MKHLPASVFSPGFANDYIHMQMQQVITIAKCVLRNHLQYTHINASIKLHDTIIITIKSLDQLLTWKYVFVIKKGDAQHTKPSAREAAIFSMTTMTRVECLIHFEPWLNNDQYVRHWEYILSQLTKS